MAVNKVRISAVSYLNTIPFVYGIQNSGLEGFELSLDTPSECARKLITGQVDLGLVPVAAIIDVDHPHILTDYCIGADGPVRTVNILSDVPIEEVENIYLDYQSRTSVLLAKIMVSRWWKVKPNLLDAFPGYEQKIKGTTAGLVIGDRVFTEAKKHAYSYDLAEEWKKMTNLPFTFAMWVANKPLSPEFKKNFSRALEFGLLNKTKAVELYEGSNINKENLLDYLENAISYNFDSKKDEALHQYLQLGSKYMQPQEVGK